MSLVIEGAMTWAASLMILGPKPSIPVAFEASSLLMKDTTWSHVIGGIWKSVPSVILLSVRRCNFSKLGDSSVFSFKVSVMDEK